jgi:hypothetical protein
MSDIEKKLGDARPSRDSRFSDKVRRLIRPAELTGTRQLFWTSGMNADLWELFCACISGDLPAVKRLLDKDPALARGYYEYRTPIAFAVRHNQVAVAACLLDHGADIFGTSGDLLDVARRRGFTEMARLLEAPERAGAPPGSRGNRAERQNLSRKPPSRSTNRSTRREAARWPSAAEPPPAMPARRSSVGRGPPHGSARYCRRRKRHESAAHRPR